MVQAEDSQQSLDTVYEQVFTPEVFSPFWHNTPVNFLDISLKFPYSLKEWDRIFTGLIDLLDDKDFKVWDRAIDRLIYALEMETSQLSNYEDYQPRSLQERLKSIFDAIAAQALAKPTIFEDFCSSFKFLGKKSPYKDSILQWLDELGNLEDRQAPTQEIIFATKILFGTYDSTWQEVGTTLLELLDHADDVVRACAAYQIGKFYGNAILSREEFWRWSGTNKKYPQAKQTIVGMPSPEIILQLIRSKEIDRPGVAGAFWNTIPKKGIDTKEWLLDVLERSAAPEPYIPYFPCNLAFYAHEQFRQDANAVRRLIDMGRPGIAVAAATDESGKVPALEPLLIELGYCDDTETTRFASWHLAYYYHYLHPRGEELNYVELVRLSEVDLFLLFSRGDKSEPPYATVLYPSNRQELSLKTAQKWVDQILPDEIRGERCRDLPFRRGWYQQRHVDCQWYQRGYVDYRSSKPHGKPNVIDNVIIGYRSKLPWNPKQFL